MKKMTALALLVALLVGGLPALAQTGAQTPSALCAAAIPAETPANLAFTAAEDVLQDGVDYLAVLCTTAGPILVDLYEDQTPLTVNNFVFLAEAGYFNNTNFHRVIADFMAQGGDPTNSGSGGPGYQFADEIVEGLVFDRPGLLAMANAGANTNGSQFFITTAPTDWLNGAHTIFGEVLTGQGNVAALRLRDPQQALEPGSLLETVVIVEGAENVEAVEETLIPATREDAEAALAAADGYVSTILDRVSAGAPVMLSSFYAADEAARGVLDTEAVVASTEGAQAAAAAYYADHNHAYSVRTSFVSTACDMETFPVTGFTYQVDAYPTAEDAAAALADPALADLLAAQGFTTYAGEVELGYPVYTRPQTDCEMDTVAARAYVQQGRFVTAQEIVVTAENSEIAAFLPELLARPIFEDAFNRLLRPESAAASE